VRRGGAAPPAGGWRPAEPACQARRVRVAGRVRRPEVERQPVTDRGARRRPGRRQHRARRVAARAHRALRRRRL
ncbi:MAG: hypothetical protein AVDCRST_MAG32-1404, partial [uncultured Nocardioides sp.]